MISAPCHLCGSAGREDSAHNYVSCSNPRCGVAFVGTGEKSASSLWELASGDYYQIPSPTTESLAYASEYAALLRRMHKYKPRPAGPQSKL